MIVRLPVPVPRPPMLSRRLQTNRRAVIEYVAASLI